MKRNLDEIIFIEKACKISDLCFKKIIKHLKEDATEKEISKKIINFLKSESDGIAFKPIVSFGENSSEIHHRPTNRKLQKGDVIMLDFGAKVNGYCADISRTIFFGKISGYQKKVYHHVLQSQLKALIYLEQKIKNNGSCKASKVDGIARKYLKIKDYDLPHSLGHGVGKKVHQGPRLSPKSKNYLRKGMVFTIEPGVYLKEFGIRIEDTVVIEGSKVRLLTKSSKEIIVIRNH